MISTSSGSNMRICHSYRPRTNVMSFSVFIFNFVRLCPRPGSSRFVAKNAKFVLLICLRHQLWCCVYFAGGSARSARSSPIITMRRSVVLPMWWCNLFIGSTEETITEFESLHSFFLAAQFEPFYFVPLEEDHSSHRPITKMRSPSNTNKKIKNRHIDGFVIDREQPHRFEKCTRQRYTHVRSVPCPRFVWLECVFILFHLIHIFKVILVDDIRNLYWHCWCVPISVYARSIEQPQSCLTSSAHGTASMHFYASKYKMSMLVSAQYYPHHPAYLIAIFRVIAIANDAIFCCRTITPHRKWLRRPWIRTFRCVMLGSHC